MRATERTGRYWGKSIVAVIPVSSLRQINKVLGRNFVTKYGSKQGVVVLGKVIPFGIGMAIGAGANAGFARVTIKSAQRAFGPAPVEWPEHLGGPRDAGDAGSSVVGE